MMGAELDVLIAARWFCRLTILPEAVGGFRLVLEATGLLRGGRSPAGVVPTIYPTLPGCRFADSARPR